MNYLEKQYFIAWQDILTKSERVLAQFYQKHRPVFFNWMAQKFNCEQADAEDIYQDAFMIFYRQVNAEQITSFSAIPKTYLFGIGKNLFLKNRQRQQRTQLESTISDHLYKKVDLTMQNHFEQEYQKVLFHEAIIRLEEKDQIIMYLFYYKNYSMEAIKNELKLKNEGLVRVRKWRSIKRLQQILNKQRA